MADWIRIASAAECPPGAAIEREAAGRIVAICRVGDAWHALDGVCPHQGGPLGQGSLCGTVLTCPWHGWQFDVTTGRHRLNATMQQPRFEVEERDGELFVKVEPASS
jgi:nitrite reductase/ring-hydroxylating ferredoxin subunit